jgi:uncharacterized integral membrane protein
LFCHAVAISGLLVVSVLDFPHHWVLPGILVVLELLCVGGIIAIGGLMCQSSQARRELCFLAKQHDLRKLQPNSDDE